MEEDGEIIFSNEIQQCDGNWSSAHSSLRGICDDHYPGTGTDYTTNHIHTYAWVESDTAIWVR